MRIPRRSTSKIQAETTGGIVTECAIQSVLISTANMRFIYFASGRQS